MVKSHPHKSSKQRTNSIASRQAATPGLYAQKPAKDRRGKTNNRGEQGEGKCPSCEVAVTLRLVSYNLPSRFGDLPAGSIVLGSHRPGGGTVSVRRGDVLCPGAGMCPVQS